jgi:uncharacterized protein (TIGR02284 family)
MRTDDYVKILKDLIKTCEDGKKEYDDAAEHVSDTNLKRELQQLAMQRDQYTANLIEQINQLSPGENIPESGSLGGKIHRSILDLKSAISKNENKAVLNEIVKAEESAVKNYESALQNNLTGSMNNLIRFQYSGIVEALDRMKSLRDYEEEKQDL